MPRDELETSVRAYFEAVAAGDRERLLELFHPRLRWRVPRGAIAPYAGVHEGAEQIADLMLGAVGGAFVPGSQRTEMRSVFTDRDRVVVETELTARTPSGDEYRNEYAFFFEFRDGRISEIREYVDTRLAADFFSAGGE